MANGAIVRISSRDDQNGPSQWWVYSTVDGHAIAKQTPTPPQSGQPGFSREIDAKLVRGTEFIGVHWLVYEGGKQSAVFELIDREGKVSWTRRIDAEYAGRPEGWRWWSLLEEGIEQLEVRRSAFAIVSYAEGKRTNYAISKGEGGAWTVTETGKEDATPAAHPRSSGSAPELKTTPGTLKLLCEVKLGAPVAESAIGGISGICFDGRGRMGWVRLGRGARSLGSGSRWSIEEEGRGRSGARDS